MIYKICVEIISFEKGEKRRGVEGEEGKIKGEKDKGEGGRKGGREVRNEGEREGGREKGRVAGKGGRESDLFYTCHLL